MMAITFRKSWKLFPGVRLNVGRRTYSSTGRVTTSADLPGPFGWRTSRRR